MGRHLTWRQAVLGEANFRRRRRQLSESCGPQAFGTRFVGAATIKGAGHFNCALGYGTRPSAHSKNGVPHHRAIGGYSLRFVALLLLLLAKPCLVEAQQLNKTVRVVMALAGTPEGLKYRVDAFVLGMRELGYTEGKNLLIEYRYTGGTPEGRREVVANVIQIRRAIRS